MAAMANTSCLPTSRSLQIGSTVARSRRPAVAAVGWAPEGSTTHGNLGLFLCHSSTTAGAEGSRRMEDYNTAMKHMMRNPYEYHRDLEEAGRNPKNEKIQMEMKKINDEIKGKRQQIASLERQIPHSMSNSQGKVDKLKLSPSYAELLGQLNEKSFELEYQVLKEFSLTMILTIPLYLLVALTPM